MSILRTAFRSYGGSIAFTVAALSCAFWLGYSDFVGHRNGGPSIAGGLAALFTALMLGALETSLSFDNAVVNARILQGMSHFWRRMFLTVGVLIAVFGMRIVFPLVIVWAVSDHTALSVLRMTWQNPGEFQKILIDQHVVIAGFGGAFLWMVFTKFFLDEEKELHWVPWIERPMAKIGRVESIWVVSTLALVFGLYRFVPGGRGTDFVVAAVAGVFTFLVVEAINSLLESKEEEIGHGGPSVASAGFGAFLYLEVLDASFSFDGVIGAFAITSNLFLIALGLGIGAMFVRSITIHLVEAGTLARYKFLEHGAFWAIGALAMILFAGALGAHLPEVVSGGIGIALIGLSLWSSVRANRNSGI
ncbi:MAG TPA: DUF475 domain-containing protein [Fibrobacteria bacterium]|nr:DUF475 domain-containing protein [Fibrobacteria bacterium]